MIAMPTERETLRSLESVANMLGFPVDDVRRVVEQRGITPTVMRYWTMYDVTAVEQIRRALDPVVRGVR